MHLLKNGPFPASFFFIFVFYLNTVDSNQMFKINFPMTGFEPRTSGIGSDRSTNFVTATFYSSVASNTKGPGFEYSHWHLLLNIFTMKCL